MVLPGKGMSFKEFARALKEEWQRDRVNDAGAALTFFGVLALFPFLLSIVSLAALVIDPARAQVLVDELSRVAPQDVTSILENRLQSIGRSQPAGLLTVGFLGALWAASSGVVALMRALNTAYGVYESRPFWKVRGIAVLTTIAAAVLSIVAATLAVVAPAVAARIGGPVETIVGWLRFPVAGLLMMLVWALLYYYLPDVKQSFKLITPGSVVGVVLWLIASWGFSLYVSNFGNYDVTYGTLGGVVVLLLWMWISSMVVMLGAEINAILEHRSPEGKKPGSRSFDDAGPAGTKSEEEAAGPARTSPAPGRPVRRGPPEHPRPGDGDGR